MNPIARLLAAALLASTGAAATAETAQLARDTPLLAQPLGDAAVVAKLKAGTTLTVKARRGAWAEVATAAGQAGHVRILNLRSTGGSPGDSGVGTLANVFRTGSSGNSVATGVKGMSAEDLTTAEPDAAQLAKLQGLGVDAQAARSAAARAGLKAREVPALPDPKDDR